MNYKKYCKVFISRLTVALAFTVLTACGGGGGGGEFSLPGQGVSYSGVTDQTALTDSATVESIALALAGSSKDDPSQFAGGAVISSDALPIERKAPQSIIIERLKQDGLNLLQQSIDSGGVVSGATYIATETGNCLAYGEGSNGEVVISVVQQSSSKITAKMDYNNLCISDGTNFKAVMNGDVYFIIKGDLYGTGRLDEMRFYYPSFTVTFTDLITTDSVTATYSNDIILAFTYYDVAGTDVKSITVSVNTYLGFNGQVVRFEVYLLENYDVDGFLVGTPTETLRFYHPDYGWVTYTVDVTFEYACGDGSPSAGQVTITGSDGSATFTVDTCNTYTMSSIL